MLCPRPTRLTPGYGTVTGGVRSRIVNRNIHFSHYRHTNERRETVGVLTALAYVVALCVAPGGPADSSPRKALKSLARTRYHLHTLRATVKTFRSSTAIRKPARTLARVIPAVATVLPPAVGGSPSVGGGRQITMPLVSATQVAVSRLTRILLLVAVALCLGAPTAGAKAAPPLDPNLEALWKTVLQTTSTLNSYGTGGLAFACWNLNGTVAPATPAPTGVPECKVAPGTKIFVQTSFECSTFPGDDNPPPPSPWTEAQLRDCARGKDVKVAPKVKVDGKSVKATEVETPLMNILLPEDNILGLPEGERDGQSVAHGWVTLLDPLTPGTHTIEIDKRGNAPKITTKIVVQ